MKFTATHEWANLEGDICTVGITKHAVELLTDLVYADLPEIGKQVSAGSSMGVIESVKAVSDIYAPVDGVIDSVNGDIVNDLSKVTNDPYGEDWLIKIKIQHDLSLDHLLSEDQYNQYCENL